MHLHVLGEQLTVYWRWLTFLIFPAYCTYCKDIIAERKALCSLCISEIDPVVATKILLTQKYQMPVYAVGVYQEPLKQLILAKLYGDILACYYSAQLIHEQIKLENLQADYLVPIPLHWTRYAKRGYNQAEEIARYLSLWTGIPVLHALKRGKKTPSQASLDKTGRQENVHDAFQLNLKQDVAKNLTFKRLLVVDDVMTTGATLHAAGRTLLTLKPLHLSAVALARTK